MMTGGQAKEYRSAAGSVAGRLCHAAALSWLLKRKLRLDPAKEEFIGDDEANGLRSLPSRKVL